MYDEEEPKPEPAGCRDTLVLTRVAFAVLMWPVLAILGTLVALGVIIYLFFTNPALALIPIGIVVLVLVALARWERGRPPKL